jgi:hypothetical protein
LRRILLPFLSRKLFTHRPKRHKNSSLKLAAAAALKNAIKISAVHSRISQISLHRTEEEEEEDSKMRKAEAAKKFPRRPLIATFSSFFSSSFTSLP